MSASGTSVVWLRDDLRIADNPALGAAVARGGRVAALYLLDEVSPGIRPLGGASRWWLHNSLSALSTELEAIGGSLTLRRGAAAREVPRFIDETGATAVYWNRRYGRVRETDAAIKAALRTTGVEVESFAANLLFEPWTVQTDQGTPYRVFTPFWRACLQREVRAPLDGPPAINGLPVAGDELNDWALLPTHPDWAGGLRETWQPGESGAGERLEHFASRILERYDRRDEPGIQSTSMLSPHLRFGEISPHTIWERLRGALSPAARHNAPKFLSEVGWREFNWNILYNFPTLATDNFRPDFDAFPWETPTDAELTAWRTGTTGVPLVDAGMRELWHTGYMHNRVRMVAASFLVKNLLVDWRIGEQWFWDTLVDADEASNPGNWQWVAGSGADAAPYFRVFNPLLQADKFDPDRAYIDRWMPAELATDPIVDLRASRDRALAAYEAIKRAGDRR